MAEEQYPRPDFQRTRLRWQSLNGSWDFLFDDEDVGLAQQWQHKGLPTEVGLREAEQANSQQKSRSESLMQTISAHPDKLIKDNTHVKSSNSSNRKRKIIVPYVFQCPASGVNERAAHEVLWYERDVSDLRTDEEKERGDCLIIRFGAVDYIAQVYLDGQYVGGHRGGHVSFDIDISDAFNASPSKSKRLTVRVFDSTADLTQPRGKQYWKPKSESIFYTPSSGIWQSVWLEVMPAVRIADASHGTILRSDDVENGILHARIAISGRRVGQRLKVQLIASLCGKHISQSEVQDMSLETDSCTVDLPMQISPALFESLPTSFKNTFRQSDLSIWHNNTGLWSPNHPLLYDLTILLFSSTSHDPIDSIQTTTGMRSISWSHSDSTFRLNDRPLFQALTLDQGYWPETYLTPPSPSALKDDILLAKSLGFNGCRKHQKVEDPLFHYYADRLGYLVWGEMANAYAFSPSYVESFDAEWLEAVKRDINHPCIVTWTPVNESWGYTDLASDVQQRNHLRALCYMTKALDPTRPVNDNCGWEHVCNDLTTFHDYAGGEELTKTCASVDGILGLKAGREVYVKAIEGVDGGCRYEPGTPIICTEFAGINIAPTREKDKDKDKADGSNLDWGYTTASDPDDLLARIRKMVRGIVEGGHVCGFVFTQLVDIEQEVNGLLTYDRKPKLEAGRVKQVMDEAVALYHEKLKGGNEA